MNASREFRASWDRATWISTVVLLAILLASSIAMIYAARRMQSDGQNVTAATTVAAAVGILILLVTLVFFAPRRYRIEPDGITVVRLGPNVRIAAQDLVEVHPIELHYMMRTCGAGGVFGAWGWFTSRELDSFRAYVTRRRGLVVVRRRSGVPIVLSPDEPGEFVEAARVLARRA